MPSESRSPKPKKADSKERKEPRASDQARSSSSGSSNSSRSKRSKSRRSRSNHRDSHSRDRGSRAYQGSYPRREPEKIAPTTKLFVTNIDSKVPPAPPSSPKKNSTETYAPCSNLSAKYRR